MQFQVPQFIETEDKVVGPFSLRQFIYVGVGGVISAMLYFVLQTWLFAIFSFFIMSVAVALAFVRVQGRPLVKVVTSAASFYWNPQIYVWKSERTVVKPRKYEPGGVAVEDAAADIAKRAALQNALADSALHKSWENLQTGSPLTEKTSDKQFFEKQMEQRYQIFQKTGGDRGAARRVDYR